MTYKRVNTKVCYRRRKESLRYQLQMSRYFSTQNRASSVYIPAVNVAWLALQAYCEIARLDLTQPNGERRCRSEKTIAKHLVRNHDNVQLDEHVDAVTHRCIVFKPWGQSSARDHSYINELWNREHRNATQIRKRARARKIALPFEMGHMAAQELTGPRLMYWPSANSIKKSGMPQTINMSM